MFKYVIYYFGIELPEGLEPIAEYGFNVGLVSLTVLFCFIHVFGYLIGISLLKYYNLENKYPRFKYFFNNFEKIFLFFLILEGIIGFGGLLGLTFLGFYPLFA